MDLITSTQNPRIKDLLQLEKARNRKKRIFLLLKASGRSKEPLNPVMNLPDCCTAQKLRISN